MLAILLVGKHLEQADAFRCKFVSLFAARSRLIETHIAQQLAIQEITMI